ncbi:uncharacterized protein LOC115213336 [Octopus sinensis]|uniref:ATP-dependent DNA helicase n=1 Tax=Octopus sinensis TaxID=2607531 RepID=A0A6P7SJL9_9MOLL|nr:uncharacterized protein LOC115213336 [Octopus sinensis]
MAHKGAIEALDRTLQDVRECPQSMGGLTILFSGDFRQTLPVIPKSTRADQVRACLKSSSLWSQVTTLILTTIMRVRLHGDIEHEKFAEDLLLLGDGRVPKDQHDQISIQHLCSLVGSIDDLKSAVFPQLPENLLSHAWLCERANLAPTNVTVSAINRQLLETLPGNSMVFKSIDSNVDPFLIHWILLVFLHTCCTSKQDVLSYFSEI